MADLPPVNRRSTMTRLFGAAALPAEAHAGLVFERYGRFWNVPGTALRKPVGPAVAAFVREYNRQNDARRAVLDRIHERQRAAMPAGGRVEERTVETSARLTMGLGVDHPLENGFTFDRVIGVPYLPATSLKGLCRAASELLDEKGTEERLQYLGSRDSRTIAAGDPRQRGGVCFLDAYPVESPQLEADVLTPHYKRYYDATGGNGRNEGPVDWDSPNPVTFLTVAAETRFLIRLLCDAASGEQQRALDWTWRYLLKGLELLGFGAKTAVGYGVMAVKEPEGTRPVLHPVQPGPAIAKPGTAGRRARV